MPKYILVIGSGQGKDCQIMGRNPGLNKVQQASSMQDPSGFTHAHVSRASLTQLAGVLEALLRQARELNLGTHFGNHFSECFRWSVNARLCRRQAPYFPSAGSSALGSLGLTWIFSGNTILPLTWGTLCAPQIWRTRGAAQPEDGFVGEK